MTQIIATFEVKNIPDDRQREEIKDILIEIGEKNNMDLISWGTI